MCFVSHQSTTLSGHALVATDPSIHQHHHHQHRTAAMHTERTRQASRGKEGECIPGKPPVIIKCLPMSIRPARWQIVPSNGRCYSGRRHISYHQMARLQLCTHNIQHHHVVGALRHVCIALCVVLPWHRCMTCNLHSEAAAVTSSTIHAHRDNTDTDQKARSHTGGEGGMRGAGTYGLLMESCTGGCTCHRRRSESLPQHARAAVRSCGSKKVEKKTIKNPR